MATKRKNPDKKPRNHGSKLPVWLQGPAALVMRLGLALPTLGGLRGVTDAAGQLGRTFGGAPFNRKRLERALENLREAFPDWSEERRRQCALDSYGHV